MMHRRGRNLPTVACGLAPPLVGTRAKPQAAIEPALKTRTTFASEAPEFINHPIEGTAGAAEVTPVSTSLAILLARHLLRDGELVILILKPSLWFILLTSMRFIA